MTLTNPLGLLGLLALPVIAALHMLRARSRRIEISSLSLWSFLTPVLRGASARRLPFTLLLVLDLLIAALLSLALAGPRLPLSRPVREGMHLVVLLDTSTSMAAVDISPSRFASALADAQDLVASRGPQDLATIIGFSGTASTLADTRERGFEAAMAELARLQPGGRGANLSAALALAYASIDPNVPGVIHIFSDGAYSPPDWETSDLPLVWHGYGIRGENQAVLDVDAVPLAGAKFQVFARFANYGRQAAARIAVVVADGRRLVEVEVPLEPGTSQPWTWEFIGSAAAVTVLLDGADDLPADDQASTGVSSGAQNRISAVVVAEQPGPLPRALSATGRAEVQVIAPDDYLPGGLYDLIVFRGYLPERWPGGTVLVVDPPESSDLLGEVRPEPVAALPVPLPDPLLEGVDLSGVRWSRVWVPARRPPGLATVLAAGNLPLLQHGLTGLTDLVLLLAETADDGGAPSALARHPAFPVLVANVVERAAGARLPDQVPLGAAVPLPLAARYPTITIAGADGEIPAAGAWTAGPAPGIYRVTATDLDGQAVTFSVGVNAGDLAESDIAPGDWPLELRAPDLPAAMTEQPTALAPWLLGLAVLLLLAEAWLAWR